MKKIIYLLLSILFLNSGENFVYSQEAQLSHVDAPQPPHHIIFQLTSGDTLAHKQLMKQIANIQKVAPGTKMEIVCHGPGLDMLVIGKSVAADKIKEFANSGVAFNACEFSMQERKVEKAQILSAAGTVPAGIIEIVSKQEQGWSYIKAGF